MLVPKLVISQFLFLETYPYKKVNYREVPYLKSFALKNEAFNILSKFRMF